MYNNAMIGFIFIIFALLTGCNDKIRVVGHAPIEEEASKTLLNKNIEQLKQQYLIAQNIKNKTQYYLGQMKYKYNKTLKITEIIDQNVYQLTVNKNNIVTNIISLPIQKNQKELYSSMPKMPDKGSLLSKLFADIGAVAII